MSYTRNRRADRRPGTRRVLLTALAALLLVTLSIGGTVAWLTATSSSVTNTFKPSTIGVTVTETKGNTFQFVPGVNITKDPVVTATSPDADAWVFVTVTKSANWPEEATFAIADGWTLVNGTTNVYAREYAQNATPNSWAVIKDNTITVSSEMTKADMDELTEDATLSFQGYIIQKAAGATAEAAWAVLNPTPATGE